MMTLSITVAGVIMQYKLILGNRAYSSWSLRGWLLMKPFAIDFEYEVVALFTPEFDRFLEAYPPANTVPALEVTGDGVEQTLWDSLAIAEYLHERHPGAGIWPADDAARAAARCLCAEMHSSYAALRSNMPMNVRREYKTVTADAATRADIDRIEQLWAWARANWGGRGPYLFGERFCAADAFYAPVASRFRTYRVPLQPASQAYAEALLEHPATREFCDAGRGETRIIEQVEFDRE